MARSIPALVKPIMLTCARERSGLSVEAAAAKAKLEPALLAAWESEGSEERPSISQVRKLGEICKRPLAVFFLPEPLRGFRAMKTAV